MASLSIILPWRAPDHACEDTLVSLLQNRPRDCEILVVHAGEYSDPYDLAGEVRFVAAPGDCGLIEQINWGFRASRGEVVHLVQRGLEATDGWSEPALAHFDDRSVAAVAPLVMDSLGEQIVTAGVNLALSGARKALRKSGGRTAGPDLLAGFWRRSAWEGAGGFDPAFGEHLADIDMALTLTELGYSAAKETASRLSRSADHSQPISSWRRGRLSERLYWKHLPRRRRLASVALHGIAVAAETVASIPRPRQWPMLAGRLGALLQLSGRGSASAGGDDGARERIRFEDHYRRRDSGALFPERELLSPPQRKAVQA
ncbi:MAG: hypothetical protein KY475_17165 [Planctomycetes bacterium]|nr:hypothetical protein [Planctomycetota bacterium]